jgi:hypothetical protein
MHQPPIVLHPLLEADEEFPEPIVPSPCTFDDPATCWMSLTSRDALTAMAEVGGVVPFHRA